MFVAQMHTFLTYTKGMEEEISAIPGFVACQAAPGAHTGVPAAVTATSSVQGPTGHLPAFSLSPEKTRLGPHL